MRVVVVVVAGLAVVVASACEPRTITPDNPKALCRFTAGSDAWQDLTTLPRADGGGGGTRAIPRIVSVAVDARVRGFIVAGTESGIYTSTNCGVDFAHADDGPRGIVNAVASGAGAGDFIASAGGLWTATLKADEQPAWTRVTSSPPIKVDARSIAMTNTGLLVASTGVTGAFNDDDGWYLDALDDPRVDGDDVAPCIVASADATRSYLCQHGERRATFAPSSADVVYAVRGSDVTGTHDSIARSNDGGATFADVDAHAGPGTDAAHTIVTGLAVDGADPAFLYATTSAPPAIWRSDDAGVTWTQRRAIVDTSGGSTNGAPVATATLTAGFAVVRTSNALLRTDDLGGTWDEETAPGAPGAGIVDVSLTSHAIAYTTVNGLNVDGVAVDVVGVVGAGARVTALTHDGDAFIAATTAGVVRVAPSSTGSFAATVAEKIGDGPSGFFVDIAQSAADSVTRIALVGGMQATIGDDGAFAPVFITDGALELSPSGDLAATSEGVLAANGEKGTCFLFHDDEGDDDGRALDGGDNGYDAVAAAADSPTVWLVSSSPLSRAVAVSVDGGASIESLGELPLDLSPPVALDGGSLALLSTRAEDGGAFNAPVVVTVDNAGAIAARTPPLPCSRPAQLVVARGLDDLAYVVAGGNCDRAFIVEGIP